MRVRTEHRGAAVAKPGTAKRTAKASANGAKGKGDLGFEATLWAAADALRGNLDAAEYKHVVLGLIFLKYISDAFEERQAYLFRAAADPDSDYYVEDPGAREEVAEERDEYTAVNVFWVPNEARWERIKRAARQPSIGQTIDAAMDAVERENRSLRGVLPRDYGRPALDKRRLGDLIDLISTIGLGDAENRAKDILGRVYEYFLGRFASAEGRSGGEFYTPRPIVRLLVEMLAPHANARVYDPCCGSGGMFVQSEAFVELHGGRRGAVSIYGQELNHTTWRLCKMNLAIRGIAAEIAEGDTFHDDRFRDLRADFVLANPPFNISAWGGERLRDDVRWQYGAPPVGNANFAWVQHFLYHLAPRGTAGFVLANGSMSAGGVEGEIRARIVQADLVDCLIALPGQLFYQTQIPVCLWFLARNKAGTDGRDRRGRTLFIDARKLGAMLDRTHRELTDEEIARIAGTYHAWRGDADGSAYADVPGFCKSATLAEVAAHGHVLTPGRYVGAEDAEDDGEPFEQKLARLVTELEQQFAESARLEATIRQNLAGLGYGR